MNLEDLRSVQADERRADSLQPLPDDFYRSVATYIESLREERTNAAERAGDPFGSEEVRLLTDEIETAEEVAEAIYERRIGKLVKQASLAAAGVPADEDGFTDEERRLFGDLVAQIETHRDEVLASLDGEHDFDVGEPEPRDSPPDPRETRPEDDPGSSRDRPVDDEARSIVEDEVDPDLDASTAMGDGVDDVSEEDESGTDAEPDGGGTMMDESAVSPDEQASGEDRMTVRITTDVGEIFGVDEHTYELAAEDVVRLPTANAEPLIEQDAAQRLE